MTEYNQFKIDINWVLGRHIDRLLSLFSERTTKNPEDRDKIFQSIYVLDALLTPFSEYDPEYIQTKGKIKEMEGKEIDDVIFHLYLSNLSKLMKKNNLLFSTFVEEEI